MNSYLQHLTVLLSGTGSINICRRKNAARPRLIQSPQQSNFQNWAFLEKSSYLFQNKWWHRHKKSLRLLQSLRQQNTGPCWATVTRHQQSLCWVPRVTLQIQQTWISPTALSPTTTKQWKFRLTLPEPATCLKIFTKTFFP